MPAILTISACSTLFPLTHRRVGKGVYISTAGDDERQSRAEEQAIQAARRSRRLAATERACRSALIAGSADLDRRLLREVSRAARIRAFNHSGAFARLSFAVADSQICLREIEPPH